MSVMQSLKSLYETWFAEREVYVRSQGSVRYITLSSRIQFFAALAVVGVVGWASVFTVRAVLSDGALASRDREIQAVHEAYQRRLDRVKSRYERIEAELEESERRFDELMAQLSSTHGQLESKGGVELALQSRLEASRRRLREITQQRDETQERLEELRLRALEMERQMAEAERLAEQRQASLNDFVQTLDATATERDAARGRVRALNAEVSSLNQRIEEIRLHQAQVMAQLEEAVQESMTELDTVLERTGVDVDGLLKEIERTYSGEGGPFVPLTRREPEAAEGFPVNIESVGALLEKLQRLNALRIAVQRLPLAIPLKDPYRLTSGFGPRRNPVTGRWSMHSGMDLAAPRGTPIYAPVDGVVVFAGQQRGYGNVVKIRHALGYETTYAHMSRIRVTKGQNVSRGDRVGDVGSTGRSTGDHLHYEIRRYRKALNPRKFIEAGRNVF